LICCQVLFDTLITVITLLWHAIHNWQTGRQQCVGHTDDSQLHSARTK
jgi:hypothetical protein